MRAALPLIFSRARTLPSVAIRAGAWFGPWSHCGVIDGDYVIESLASMDGVVRTHLHDFWARSSASERVNLICPRPEAALEWARSTAVEPREKTLVRYDWGGVIGIPLRARELDSPDRLYCGEQVRHAAALAGVALGARDMHGFHPTTLYHLVLAANAGAQA